MLAKSLFLDFSELKWVKINLAKDSAIPLLKGHPNPLLNPSTCEKWVKALTAIHNASFTYGGYLENREELWRGSYLKGGGAYHLGVDYNVPDGTWIYSCWDGEIVDRWEDPDKEFGWGGRLIIKTADKYVVLGHLQIYSSPRIGCQIKQGELIGVTAHPLWNGDWYPHLHLQYLSLECFERYSLRLTELDGYSRMYDGIEKDYPNPEEKV